jgi:DNA-binding CsgD family transcriptional regulator
VVCDEEAAFADRFPVTVGDGSSEVLWVHERCATQLAAHLLLQTLQNHDPGRPERRTIETTPAVHRAGLTSREHRALRCMASGYTNQQIAAELGVKHKTARNLVSAVLAKLDAVNRVEAVAIATREGLLD